MLFPSRRDLLSETICLLRKYGVRPKKKLSQNFIVSPRLLRRIVHEVSKEKPHVTLEIGSGLGTLTKYLAHVSKKVIAIEIDEKLVRISEEVLRNYSNVEIIVGDFLEHYKSFREVDVIVSNVPYHISSKLLFTLSEMVFKKAVLTLQREFASRLFAKPGTQDYSRLTVMANVYFTIQKVFEVGPYAFYPPPKVSSTLITLTRKEYSLPVDPGFFDRLVRILFASKNRVVESVLKNASSHGLIKFGFEEAKKLKSILRKRVRELTLGEIVEIAKVLHEANREIKP
ncbi:MAG: ribosomal RNA small subunit methyltransferase A [Thermoprotei archaeon]|nr:ribosomal RNA small subunit methyltransferase A [Thermoprotei archaeon]